MINFTSGKIFKPLLLFIIPILGALFLQSLYGAVDLIVVGQFATVADVSGVSTGSQINYIPMMLISGLATGTTVLIGQKIGEGRLEDAGKVVGSAIALFGAIAIVVSILFTVLSKPICIIMQTPSDAFVQTQQYVVICALGTVFITAYNVLGALFRGLGDSKTPLFAVVIATIINIIGDIVCVAIFHLGSAGAALATVLAQTVSVILCLIKIRGTLPFEFKKSYICFDKENIGKILNLGLPIALQSLLVNISFLVILAIVNSLGVIASAGVGVAEKLCNFIMLIPSAFSQGVSSFVAQNYGARQMPRARKGLLYSIAASELISLLVAGFSFFKGDLLCRIFASDPEVIEAGFLYLKAYALDTCLVSILFCMIGFFNGCGKTKNVMINGIIAACGVRLPVSFIMSRIEPVSLFNIGCANPIATVIQISLFLIAYYFIFVKYKEDIGDRV